MTDRRLVTGFGADRTVGLVRQRDTGVHDKGETRRMRRQLHRTPADQMPGAVPGTSPTTERSQGAMPVQLNHTIVHASDQKLSAAFLADLLGLPQPTRYGPFLVVQAANDVSLDVLGDPGRIQPQHYAFLVTEKEFDEIFARIQTRGLAFWADPFHEQPSQINHNDGGRGVYWSDPDGHSLEIITRPYGAGEH